MIVTCEQCHTRFHLEDSRIKSSGSKVRCAKCRHIFKIYPALTESVVESEIPATTDQPSIKLPDVITEINIRPPQSEIGYSTPERAALSEFQLSDDTENEFDLSNLDESKIKTERDPADYSRFESNQTDLPFLDFEIGSSDENASVESGLSGDQPMGKTFPSELEPESISQEISSENFEPLDLDALNLTSEPVKFEAQHDRVSESDTGSTDLFEMDFSFEADSVTPQQNFSVQEIPSFDVNAPNRSTEAKQFDSRTDSSSTAQSVSSDEIVFQDIEAMDLDDIEKLIDNREDSSSSFSQTPIAFGKQDQLTPKTDPPNLEDFDLTHLEMDQPDSDASPASIPALEIVRPEPLVDLPGPLAQKSIPQVDLIKNTDLTQSKDVNESGLMIDPSNESETFEDEVIPDLSKEKRTVSMPLLILFGIVLILGGGYAAMTWFPDLTIPFLKREQPAAIPDPGNLKIKAHDINSKFIDNSTVGKLFVITGKTRNEYPENRKQIKITGKLYTRDKKLAKTETVFCGNVISDSELADITMQAIQQRMGNPDGDNQMNAAVKPSESIPFMIVFSELPDNLEEFTLEVAHSKKG
ncbi:MAG TPA: zinc-ribbon domain-containing protein [Desulfatirhabdiaceae bacterium]|nr:zinc-ribbon domain-containing protein [Desulfatirhabdiaceae bacterium]